MVLTLNEILSTADHYSYIQFSCPQLWKYSWFTLKMTQSLNLQVLEFWEHLDSILYFEWHWQDKKVVITITFLGSNRQLVRQSIIGFLFFVWSLTLLNVYCNHFSKNNKLIVTCTVTRTISNFQRHVNINNNWLTVSLLIIIGIFASLPMCFSSCAH